MDGSSGPLSRPRERLRCRLLGMPCENPVTVASGPMTDSEAQIRNALAAGAGAVVTKTIFEGPPSSAPERVRRLAGGLLNTTTYSERPLAGWLRVIRACADDRLPVVVSIHATEPAALGELARVVAGAGARALELGIACPTDGSQQSLTPARVHAYARAASATGLPCSVKLGAMDDFVGQARAAVEGGARAISMSDSLPGLLVDAAAGRLELGDRIGYSGQAIKPIVQRAVHELRRAGIDCEVLGVGGVASAADVLEYLQIGASTVQIYSALVQRGLRLVTEIVAELDAWCEERGTTAVAQVGRCRHGR